MKVDYDSLDIWPSGLIELANEVPDLVGGSEDVSEGPAVDPV